MKKKFIPDEGQMYYYIILAENGEKKIRSEEWHDNYFDNGVLRRSNVFRTSTLAKKALKGINKVLNESEKG